MFLRSLRAAVSLVVLSSALTTVSAISDDDFHAVIAHHNGHLQKQRVTSFPTYVNVDMLETAAVVAPNTVLIADGQDYFNHHTALQTFFKANPEILFRLDLKALDLHAETMNSSPSFFKPNGSLVRSLPQSVYLSNTKGDIKEIDVSKAKIASSVVCSEALTSLTLIDFPELTKIGNGLFGSNSNLLDVTLVGLPKLEEVGNIFEKCPKLNTVDFSDLPDTVKYDTSKGFCGGANIEHFLAPSPCGPNAMNAIHEVNVKHAGPKSHLVISLGGQKKAANPELKQASE